MSDLDKLNDYEEVSAEELIQLLQTTDITKESTDTLYKKCGSHFKKEFDYLYAEIESKLPLSSDDLIDAYNLISAIKKPNIDFKKFIELCDIPTNHPLITTFNIREVDKSDFLNEVSEKIKDWKLSGKSLSYSIRKFRMSPEGRKCITRKTKLDVTDDLLNEFISSFHKSERAEIFTRIEKYIESGWFEKDNPFEEYFLDNTKKPQAIYRLKESMGKRFFEASVKEISFGDSKYHEYELELHKDRPLLDAVFSIAKSGSKDYCIESVDGKRLFVGDVTTEDTGYNNGYTWLATAKAVLNFKRKNPEVDVNYSVSLMSLFYDTDTPDRQIKKSFIDKFSENTPLNIAQWHLILYLAVLDRDDQDFNFDIKELFNITTLNFFGTESEGYCNTVLKLKKEDFIVQVLDDFKSILHNITEKGLSINARGMDTNVESIPIHLLTSAIKGFEFVINDKKDLIAKYCELREYIDILEYKVPGVGHIGKELRNLSTRLKYPDEIYEQYIKTNKRYKDAKNLIDEEKTRQELYSKENMSCVNKVVDSFHDLINGYYNDVLPLIDCQRECRAVNYKEPLQSIIRVLSKLKSDPENNDPLCTYINYNRQTIETNNNNALKDITLKLIKCINYSTNKTQLMNHISNFKIEVESYFENTRVLSENLFPTYTRLNTQNKLSIYGRFIHEELNVSKYANSDMIQAKEAEFFEKIKSNFKNKLELLSENLNEYQNLKSVHENGSTNRLKP